MNMIKLIVCIAICQFAGLVGSLFTFQSIPTWYASLAKPFFTPPNWLFGPVWITLYILMGIALYLLWEKGLKKNNTATRLFITQLVLNAAWSVIFFGMQLVFIAFIEIVILWAFIALTIWKLRPVDTKAAWVMLPYIIWVTIAAALNMGVWLLN